MMRSSIPRRAFSLTPRIPPPTPVNLTTPSLATLFAPPPAGSQATTKYGEPLLVGRVTANYGRSVRVEEWNNKTIERIINRRKLHKITPVRCTIKGKGLKFRPVTGDFVNWHMTIDDEEGLVTNLLPRRNLIERVDKMGRHHILAANVDHMGIVVAPEPEVTPLVIDRLLVGAHFCSTTPTIIMNKSDLLSDVDVKAKVIALAELYISLGYSVVFYSSKTGEGLAELHTRFTPLVDPNVPRLMTSILVGQSGTGKSSILNSLLPELNLKEQELSRIKRGKHTTSASTLYHLPIGGDIIDSPGFDNFFPHCETPHLISNAFPEFLTIQNSGKCHFPNCKHMTEPNCAVIAGVQSGAIAQSRYNSFCRLVRMAEEFIEKTPPKQTHPTPDTLKRTLRFRRGWSGKFDPAVEDAKQFFNDDEDPNEKTPEQEAEEEEERRRQEEFALELQQMDEEVQDEIREENYKKELRRMRALGLVDRKGNIIEHSDQHRDELEMKRDLDKREEEMMLRAEEDELFNMDDDMEAVDRSKVLRARRRRMRKGKKNIP